MDNDTSLQDEYFSRTKIYATCCIKIGSSISSSRIRANHLIINSTNQIYSAYITQLLLDEHIISNNRFFKNIFDRHSKKNRTIFINNSQALNINNQNNKKAEHITNILSLI